MLLILLNFLHQYITFLLYADSSFLTVKIEKPAPTEEKRLASWGTEVPEDLVLDEKKLAEALKKVLHTSPAMAALLFCYLIVSCIFFFNIWFILLQTHFLSHLS